MTEYKIGDKVEIIATTERCFKVGDVAVLIEDVFDGDWLADFSLNPIYRTPGAHNKGDGQWYIVDYRTSMKLISLHSTYGKEIAL